MLKSIYFQVLAFLVILGFTACAEKELEMIFPGDEWETADPEKLRLENIWI
jgi:hypothetical protein